MGVRVHVCVYLCSTVRRHEVLHQEEVGKTGVSVFSHSQFAVLMSDLEMSCPIFLDDLGLFNLLPNIHLPGFFGLQPIDQSLNRSLGH